MGFFIDFHSRAQEQQNTALVRRGCWKSSPCPIHVGRPFSRFKWLNPTSLGRYPHDLRAECEDVSVLSTVSGYRAVLQAFASSGLIPLATCNSHSVGQPLRARGRVLRSDGGRAWLHQTRGPSRPRVSCEDDTILPHIVKTGEFLLLSNPLPIPPIFRAD